MTERLQPQGSRSRTASRRRPRSRSGRIWGAQTIPAAAARELANQSEPTLFGLPAEIVPDDDTGEQLSVAATPGALPSDVALVVHRRADRFAAGALVLAGVAANVSLSLSWAPGDGPSGLFLVRRGVDVLRTSMGASVPSGTWEPLVVVLCGGILVVLGFGLLIPARAHRLLGVLALVVSLAAALAVVLLMADGGWGADQFGPGMWCAAAVPVLGTIGSLKAMLTAPLVTVAPGSEDAGRGATVS
jgi:hypothetical protein